MILRKLNFIPLYLVFSTICYSQVPRLEWAKSIRGNNSKLGYSVAVDAAGNVYSSGLFFGTADFDPGPGVFNLTSNGTGDIYILKQNAAGDFLWVKQIGGPDFEEPRGLAVDPSGQVHVAGGFSSSTIDFDPGTGTLEFNNLGVTDAFILKLDTDGNLVWAKQLAGTNDEAIHALALDSDGNILTTGYFSETTDFDPGTGTFNLTSTSVGVADIFISKLDQDGNFVWAKSIGSSNYEVAYALAVDDLKNVIITAEPPGGQPIDLDPGSGTFEVTPTGSSNSLLLKLSESGDLVWANVLNGDQVLSTGAVATDDLNNIYFGGGFEGTCDFDPNAGIFTLTSTSSYDAFILKLKPDGTFDWVKNFGITGFQYLYAITTNAAREVIATGQFEDIVDFDPGGSTFHLTPRGGRDIFLTKLDENGNFVWAGQSGGDGGNEFAYSVAADIAGNIYSTGYFEGLNDFDPSICEFDLVAIDDFDVYIQKVGTAAAACTFIISQQPQSVTTCIGATATFTVEAVGTTNIQYQWQVYNDGIPDYVDLIDNANFSGTNSPILTITNVNPTHEETYRCKISGDGYSDLFSIDVTLTVIGPPGVTNVSRCGVGPVTLFASGGTNGQYRWYTTASGGTPIAGETNPSFTTPSLTATTTYFVSLDLGTCETNRSPVIATINTCAPIPELVWAKSFGGNGYGLAMETDAAGNVYTTGYFRGTTDFDPGPGTTILSAPGNNEVYISKLDASGNLVWAKSVGGPTDDQGNTITVDSNGNVYIAGIFRGTADFDPGPGSAPLTSLGGHDVFILKLDQNGDFLWVRQIGGASLSGDGVSTIKLDGTGNVCTYGYFNGTVDFNPGAPIFNLNSAGQTDLFISKLDNDGNFVSALKFGGTNFDLPGQMAIDAMNEIYCTGYFRGTSDFDPGPGNFNLNSAGGDDIFIVKLDAASNFSWANRFGGTGDDGGTAVMKDASGNILLSGYFENTIDLDPGVGVSDFTSSGLADFFILKLTATGDYAWARTVGGGGDDISQDIFVDGDDQVYIAGSFNQTVDFDPGPGTFTISSLGLLDIFVLKLTPVGDFFWAINMGGTSSDFATAFRVDPFENLLTVGGFRNDVDFDPGSGIFMLSAEGGFTTFVQKLVSTNLVISIDTQPVDVIVCEGEPGIFQVEASGTTNLTYQWQYSSDDITYVDISDNTQYSGTTTNILTINTLGLVGESRFRCRINGDFASEVVSNDEGLFVTALPALPTVSGSSRCDTGSVVLVASGASDGQYRWYPNAIDPEIAGEVNGTFTTPSLISTTSYYVSIHNGTCESSRVEVVAMINTPPAKPTITSSITPVTGTVTVCDSAPLVLSAPTGFASYAWSSSETTEQINVTLAGIYTVTVTDAVGCTSAASDPITVITDTTPASPTITSSASCGPGSVTLVASGGTNGNYRWYDVATGGTALAGEVNATFTTPTLTASATYYVSITNGNCESNRIAVTATINPVPAQPVITSSVTPIGNAITVCSTTAFTLTAPAGFTYLWSDGSTTQQITVTTSGSYSVVVSSGGCASPASDAIDVTIIPAPCTNQPPIITTTPLTTTIGSSVSINLLTLISDPDNNLVASSLAIVQGPSSGANATITGGVLTINYSGLNFAGTDLITIEVCDVFGECTQQQLEIDVIGEIVIYNAVSANGDNMNPIFEIRYIDLLPDTQQNKVTIYNRWGTVVFEVDNYNQANAFRGISSAGNELPSGTYFYKIEFTSGRSAISGYLSLKR
mgnify:CR=1 FL=1